jgi:signal transduction histidine kinase
MEDEESPMPDDFRGSSESEWLAALIDGRRNEIIRIYLNRLTTMSSRIVQDEISLSQARENATQILGDVANSLRASRRDGEESYAHLAWEIGLTRASDGVHPRESLEAASVFFRTVLEAAADHLIDQPQAFRLLGLVAAALERSITTRVQTSIAGYTSYLLNQVHDAQVNERRRIARELHDRIGRSINITHRQLELYSLYQLTDPLKANQKFKTAQRAVQESMKNLRAVTSDLYSTDPLTSLSTALLNYLDSVDADGVNVKLRVNGNESWVKPEVLDEVFLILREAAHNALQHSVPSTLIVNVDITPNEIRAYVEDDGQGFDPSQTPASGGVGVVAMRERAQLLGGSLNIHSQIGTGTHLDFAVRLPGDSDLDSY